jgi:hypothetical protein
MPGPKAMKKAAPAKVAAKGQKYEYTELKEVSLTSNDNHNVYGVVIDATFPYKINQERYVCSLKIIDPSLHYKGGKTTDNDYATVVIYGKRFEDLPIASRIGDIIRLHRATLRMFKSKRQFNVSTQWQGSWALFAAEDSAFAPISYCGKRATFEKHEVDQLKALRKWISNHFASEEVVKDQYSALSKSKKQKTDFDVVAKILSIHEMDEYTNELKIADGSDAWYCLALKLKFPHLRAGQVVYVRSATWDETSTHKQVLALSHYSNIMSFHHSSKLAAALTKSVSDDWKADAAELTKAVPSHAIVCSEVDKKHASLAQTSLNDLFHNEGSLSGNTHRVMLNVVKVEGDVKEMVRSYDKKSKKSSSAKGVKGDLIWQVSFLCKDASTAGNSNKYRVLVQSHEGLGANFFGKAANLYSDSAAFKKTEKQVANLTKFNTFVDAVVEKRNNMWLIKDTKLRC